MKLNEALTIIKTAHLQIFVYNVKEIPADAMMKNIVPIEMYDIKRNKNGEISANDIKYPDAEVIEIIPHNNGVNLVIYVEEKAIEKKPTYKIYINDEVVKEEELTKEKAEAFYKLLPEEQKEQLNKYATLKLLQTITKTLMGRMKNEE